MSIQVAVMVDFRVFNPEHDYSSEKFEDWLYTTYSNDPNALLMLGDIMTYDREKRKSVPANLTAEELRKIIRFREFTGNYSSSSAWQKFEKEMKYLPFTDDDIRSITDMMDEHFMTVNVRYTHEISKNRARIRAVIGPVDMDKLDIVFKNIGDIAREPGVGSLQGNDIYLSFKAETPIDFHAFANALGFSYNGARTFTGLGYNFVVKNSRHFHVICNPTTAISPRFFQSQILPLVNALKV